MTQRMFPPASGTKIITVNGRTHNATASNYLDVPDHDADIMEANGWTKAAEGGIAATAARPSSPKKGQSFFDSTLGYVIRFDGAVWRNPSTGASV